MTENPYASPQAADDVHDRAWRRLAVCLLGFVAVVAILVSLWRSAGTAAVNLALLNAGLVGAPMIILLKKKCSPTALFLVLGAIGGAASVLLAACFLDNDLAAHLQKMSSAPAPDWGGKGNAYYLRNAILWAVAGAFPGAIAGALAARPFWEPAEIAVVDE